MPASALKQPPVAGLGSSAGGESQTTGLDTEMQDSAGVQQQAAMSYPSSLQNAIDFSQYTIRRGLQVLAETRQQGQPKTGGDVDNMDTTQERESKRKQSNSMEPNHDGASSSPLLVYKEDEKKQQAGSSSSLFGSMSSDGNFDS
jgi:hypothetical protein